ncbi:hypothetical protein CIG75_11025 [Tumebacillus algifaecis]|uniref:HTH cro/C1-type domain-containing protein n=1 Tax=Tumebacillus algifaecis TaxID=1214604 RepID=A0A223D1V7_9BACL|nr:helix-turn-helix transcriptional regulator [Tumebacillus algifaecis]ASS75455.1 hypothetical protein CIG75_11025 [Tumebacillus algifaecis]
MSINPLETLGQRIKRLRLEKGMTQSELADDYVTVSMISQIERGKNTPSVELVQHIAKKLQVPLHDLMKNEVEQMETAWKHQLAKVYLLTKQPVEAEPLLLSLREMKELSQIHQIELTMELAECYYLQKQSEDALALLLPLVEELESVTFDDIRILSMLHNTLGNVYYQKQNYTDASYHYRRAHDLTLRFPVFDQLAARISYNVGITYQLHGHHGQSELYLKRAYEFFQNTEHIYEIAATLVAKGITYKNLHEYKLASESLTTAAGIFYAMNLIQESCDTKVTLAAAVIAKENPVAALTQLEECLRFYETAESYADLLLVYSQMALIQLAASQFDAASQHLCQAAAIIERCADDRSPSIGVYFQTHARYHLLVHNYSLAVDFAFKAAAAFASIELLADQVDSLQIACDAYHLNGCDTQAFQTAQQCCEILKRLNGRSDS